MSRPVSQVFCRASRTRTSTIRRAIVGVIGIGLTAGSTTVLGAEWFVAPGGRGKGQRGAPFGRIQDALGVAGPGDTIRVAAGTYEESLRTIRSASENAPIVVRAEMSRGVIVTARGTVLRAAHPWHVFDGLVFDGQFGPADAVRVTSDAAGLVLRGVEIRRSARDCVDMAAPVRVRIEQALIHHCLYWDGERRDAHGIAAGAVRDLVVRDSEIHTFSGDGLQADPGRATPGWDGVRIESTRMWLGPLAEPTAGFPAGAVVGENAIDTKASPAYPRARIVIRDVEARGFRGAISNQAAFNFKEHVDVSVDGVTVADSEIAFRLRGPGAKDLSHGARVRIVNAVVHAVDVAFRYEDDLEALVVWNATIGLGVGCPFRGAESSRTRFDVRNVLLVGTRLPAEAAGASNRAVSADVFADAAAGDYRLASGTAVIDSGEAIPDVAADRLGVPRPQGAGWDPGAFEWCPSPCPRWPARPRGARDRAVKGSQGGVSRSPAGAMIELLVRVRRTRGSDAGAGAAHGPDDGSAGAR